MSLSVTGQQLCVLSHRMGSGGDVLPVRTPAGPACTSLEKAAAAGHDCLASHGVCGGTSDARAQVMGPQALPHHNPCLSEVGGTVEAGGWLPGRGQQLCPEPPACCP